MTDTKEHILNISYNLFLQKNFKEVTMKEIVTQTGLSKGAFYHYFSSKEQVFSEVINHYFTEWMQDDFSNFSANSLKEFYTDILANMEAKSKSNIMPKTEQDNNNYFHLMFDAIRMLPNFKENHIKYQKKELNAWKNIIGNARLNKEISSSMTDEEIAKLFIFLKDGVNINLVMKSNAKKQMQELKQLWNVLYQTLAK